MNAIIRPCTLDGPSLSIRKLPSRFTDRPRSPSVLGSSVPALGMTTALLTLERVGGGFWTPATAFGESLIEPLERHAGLTFEVLE